VALIIEGGGMRGVICAGMVSAIEALGLTSCIDIVLGASAGALAGAFLLAGQPAMGTSLYYQELMSKDWLHWGRVLRRRAPLSLDWLVDELMGSGAKALDWEAVVSSPIPLISMATRLPDYAPVALGPHRTAPELREALRASARIPLVAGGPVRIGGQELIDGSLSEGVPLRCAQRMGFTHALVLLTRRAGDVCGEPSALHRALSLPALDRIMPGLGGALSRRASRCASETALVEDLATSHGERLLVAQVPEGGPAVAQLSQDAGEVFAGAVAGAQALHAALGLPALGHEEARGLLWAP
jgi:predicted patatin/cPLA2 family phospholipase